MKYYAAFSEELTPLEETQLTFFLFNQVCAYLKAHTHKSKTINIDIKNEKIWLQKKLFFYFDKKTRLLQTEYVNQCRVALVEVSKVYFPEICSNFFKNLGFASSEEEAQMLSDNGLLFSQSARTYKNKNNKSLPFFNGIVSSEFGINQILTCNPGLALGHVRNDTSSYAELISLLPICKSQKVKILYLELPYSVFSTLFKDFNKKKINHKLIISELKKRTSKLYQDKTFLNKYGELLIAARNNGINIQACDVNSLNFINQTELDEKHRLKVENACMIRSIEALQFQEKHPKFLLLTGLAHVQTVSHELGVPSGYIGEEKIFSSFPDLMGIVDYKFFSSSGTLHASQSSFFMPIGTRLEQTNDPKINDIISHWNALIKKIPSFSSIATKEIKAARAIYIEYILKKSRANPRLEISDICKNQQSRIIKSLTQAIYSKSIQLVHPKNWYPLFYCRRPYGIRLAENENDAFTLALLNDLDTREEETHLTKPHYA